MICTLWYFSVAIENGPVKIVSFPIENGDVPQLCKRLPESIGRKIHAKTMAKQQRNDLLRNRQTMKEHYGNMMGTWSMLMEIQEHAKT